MNTLIEKIYYEIYDIQEIKGPNAAFFSRPESVRDLSETNMRRSCMLDSDNWCFQISEIEYDFLDNCPRNGALRFYAASTEYAALSFKMGGSGVYPFHKLITLVGDTNFFAQATFYRDVMYSFVLGVKLRGTLTRPVK